MNERLTGNLKPCTPVERHDVQPGVNMASWQSACWLDLQQAAVSIPAIPFAMFRDTLFDDKHGVTNHARFTAGRAIPLCAAVESSNRAQIARAWSAALPV